MNPTNRLPSPKKGDVFIDSQIRRTLLALVAAAIALLLFPLAANGAFPGANGKIALQRCVEHLGCDIYTINPDGTKLTRLTHTPRRRTSETRPSWSPDGKKLAFDNGPDIWTLDANGTNLSNITVDSVSGRAQEATWSPDGTKIAFEGDPGLDMDRVYVMNADGSGVHALTNAPGYNFPGSYSPDGEHIAFTTTRSGTGREVWVMNADGRDQRFLVWGWLPDWSPDGRSILFTAGYELYVFDLQSGFTRRLTYGANVFRSAWSPDGTKVVFSQPDYGGGFHLFVVNADGSGTTQITQGGRNDDPDWQPLPPAAG